MRYSKVFFLVSSTLVATLITFTDLYVIRPSRWQLQAPWLFVGILVVAVVGRTSGTVADQFARIFGRMMFLPVARRICFPFARSVRSVPDSDAIASLGHADVIRDLETFGIEVKDTDLNARQFEAYLQKAGYRTYHYDYYLNSPKYLVHKQVQHFLSLFLTPVDGGDVWADIASSTSPFPEILQRLYGITVYRQDLSYPAGIHGLYIGSNAAAIPLPNSSVDRVSLHCSFEHFEGNDDCRFLRELARILKPGGLASIVPLYISPEYQILTNPRHWLARGRPSEAGARITMARDYWEGFGRFYDAAALKHRVIDPLHAAGLSYDLFYISMPENVPYFPIMAMRITKPLISHGDSSSNG